MDLFLPLLPLYLVPFFLLFVMARARFLAVAAALAVVFCGWMFTDLGRADGPGALFGLIAGAVIALGFLSGGLARALLLLRGERRPGATLLVGTLFLVGAPLLYAGWGAWQAAAHRRRWAPPPPACEARLHEVTLGGARWRLPLIAGIRVGSGREFSPNWDFFLPDKAREFCATTERDIPALTNLSIEFAGYGAVPTGDRAQRHPLCRSPRPERWWPALCRNEGWPAWPIQDINLFDPRGYDYGRMLAVSLDSDAEIARHSPQARWTRVGRFELLDGDTRFYRTGTGPTDYHAQCRAETPLAGREAAMSCVAAYRLGPALGLRYVFRAPVRGFEAEAVRIDGVVRSIIVDLRARPPGRST